MFRARNPRNSPGPLRSATKFPHVAPFRLVAEISFPLRGGDRGKADNCQRSTNLVSLSSVQQVEPHRSTSVSSEHSLKRSVISSASLPSEMTSLHREYSSANLLEEGGRLRASSISGLAELSSTS